MKILIYLGFSFKIRFWFLADYNYFFTFVLIKA